MMSFPFRCRVHGHTWLHFSPNPSFIFDDHWSVDNPRRRIAGFRSHFALPSSKRPLGLDRLARGGRLNPERVLHLALHLILQKPPRLTAHFSLNGRGNITDGWSVTGGRYFTEALIIIGPNICCRFRLSSADP
jgi:hypothetical protein